jgi:hypothetical protein
MLLLGGFAIAAALSKHALAKRGATWILARVGGRPSVVLLTNMLARAWPPRPQASSPPLRGGHGAPPPRPTAGGGSALPRSSGQCCRVPPPLRACWTPAPPARTSARHDASACTAALLSLPTASSLAARAG